MENSQNVVIDSNILIDNESENFDLSDNNDSESPAIPDLPILIDVVLSEHLATDNVTDNNIDMSCSSLDNYKLTRDREPRIRKINPKYAVVLEIVINTTKFSFLIAEHVKFPTLDTFEEAIRSKFVDKWKSPMADEIQSMSENNTWKLVLVPQGAKAIESKWVFKIKEPSNPKDEPRFKARLLAKGFSQREGIDYTKIFALVVKYKTMRILVALPAYYDIEFEHMDVKLHSYMVIK